MRRTPVRVAAAAAIAWLAFAYRFQAPGFHNDHFEHLAMARQVLFGELPGRDFFDPGRPLTVLLSAGAQAVFGHALFGEALLTIGLLAAGAAIVFWLASALSRSVVAGALAALLVIVISPRLYSYPKVIVFALALLAVWWCAQRPSIWRAILLAAVTVFALLMRHDFGVYVAVVSMVTLLLVRPPPPLVPSYGEPRKADTTPRTRWTPIAAYVIAGVVLVAPYLVWMQYNGLLASSTSGGFQSLAGAVRLTWRPLHVDLSHGVVHLDPVRARVTVRWSPATTADERQVLEERYALVQGHVEGEHTLSYGITDDSRENVRALVADPRVDDTGGIDRGSGALDAPVWKRWLSRLGVSRVMVGPFFDSADAEAWLYYLFWLIPLAGLGLVSLGVARAGLSPESITVAAAALLGVLLNLFLLRGSLDSRLPDVVIPPAIVGAWLAAGAARRVSRAALTGRIAGLAVAASAALVLGSALVTYAGVSVASLLRGPVNGSGLSEAVRFLRSRPIEVSASGDGSDVARLTRYVFDCTTDRDRLLLVAYEPSVFYYAERLFAGGIEHFHQRRFSSAPEQAKIVAALNRQHVPLVVVEDARLRMLQDDYVEVFNYIGSRYTPAGETTFGTDRLWRIYANRSVSQTRTWDGLPCFA